MNACEETDRLYSETLSTIEKNADFWVAEWDKHKDASSLAKLMYALGKVNGVSQMLSQNNNLQKRREHYGRVYDRVMLQVSNGSCLPRRW